MAGEKNFNFGLSLLTPENIMIEYLNDKNATDTEKCNFIVSPLESGFGITIGNALRRVLLSYIPGYAICKINIEGVTNEFASIDGVNQDVIFIVQQLKKIILKKKEEENYEDNCEVINIVKKDGSFTGADISAASKKFEVVNKDLLICDFNEDVVFKITIYINKGVGYAPAKNFDNKTDNIGDIHVDCIYSPIVNVSYDVKENFHLNEENRNYDSLTMEVISNGSIKAEKAVIIAAQILTEHFKLFLNNENYNSYIKNDFIEKENKFMKMKEELLNKNLSDLSNSFSSRSYNCLINAGVFTVKQLVAMKDSQLVALRNFGKKSLAEIRKFKEDYQLYLCEDSIQDSEESPKEDSHTKKKN